MKRSILGLTLLLFTACGGDSSGPNPPAAPMRAEFTVESDQSTCPTMILEISIDDVSRGQYVFTPGHRREWVVSNGYHKATALEIGGSERQFDSGYHSFDSGTNPNGSWWSIGHIYTMICS